MIVVRCKECGKEITGQPGKTLACGCPNMMTVNEDSVTAVDLTRTIMVRSNRLEEKTALSPDDLAFQEQRRKRKVRKLNFETR
tara:strand:- start:128 stop:376 length:249 start_codon:yes stop_codon:yes gene_type:complete